MLLTFRGYLLTHLNPPTVPDPWERNVKWITKINLFWTLLMLFLFFRNVNHISVLNSVMFFTLHNNFPAIVRIFTVNTWIPLTKNLVNDTIDARKKNLEINVFELFLLSHAFENFISLWNEFGVLINKGLLNLFAEVSADWIMRLDDIPIYLCVDKSLKISVMFYQHVRSSQTPNVWSFIQSNFPVKGAIIEN